MERLDPKLETILSRVQKPAQYIGGELNSVTKNREDVDIRFCFCFPDTYEIGMSHLGMKILYSLINSREDSWCERAFVPMDDMAEEMKKAGMPLFGIESGDPLSSFDVLGFTLQYEMSFTSILYMLDLGGVPILAKDRHDLSGIVVAGGPCACNPEPLADFVDVFQLGDGEELMMDFLDLYKECKENGLSKEEFLDACTRIPGLYVPSRYNVEYKEDGTIKCVTPTGGAPAVVKKRVVADMDTAFYPDKFIVPYIEIVHDRVVEETFRGCIRGCRFCQAGFIYRPIREKSAEVVDRQARDLCDSTGYDQVSLISLSTSDYSEITPLLETMTSWTTENNINISLPSLRIDTFSDELVEKLNLIRKSGLTFAPEAGSQRLRDAINKNITEDEIMNTARIAFKNGWTTVKLYFMIGLPTETQEDVDQIVELGKKVVDEFYKNPDRPKKAKLTVNISASSFVPKPFTPFQWSPQADRDELNVKQERLHELATGTRLHISCHKTNMIFVEGVLARADRRLGPVLLKVYENGGHLDAWDDHFDYDRWLDAMKECGVDPAFYANRERPYDEVLPWDHIEYGPSKKFLIRESEKAKKSETTPHCRIGCAGCGADKLNGGDCDARD